MNQQLWHEIEGYSLYLVNPYDCEIINKNTKQVKQLHVNKGYLYASLMNDYSKTSKSVAVHRTFIHLLSGNGDRVNHKDGNKLNWHINNLELVTHSENMKHAINVLGKMKDNFGIHNKKPIIAINTITNEKLNFDSIKDAGDFLNIDRRNIGAILKNKQKTAKKWTFKYLLDQSIPDLTNFVSYPNNKDYMISKYGKIYSIKLNKFLITRMSGRYIITTTKKLSSSFLHRILAETFIPNPKNLPFVDHIDRNPLNNSLDNLRWVDHLESAKNRTPVVKNKVPIFSTKDNIIIKYYDSISSVQLDGFSENMVRKYLDSEKMYKNLFWKRKDKNYINKV